MPDDPALIDEVRERVRALKATAPLAPAPAPAEEVERELKDLGRRLSVGAWKELAETFGLCGRMVKKDVIIRAVAEWAVKPGY